jgi:hypothetical protein
MMIIVGLQANQASSVPCYKYGTATALVRD